MKYIYNYSFLEKWMEANENNINDRTILKAIGTYSNTSLDAWERKKTPLPTIALLRFCNTFNVPISAFIVDMEHDGDVVNKDNRYVRPSVNDQYEPDGGYLANGAKRSMGTRALRNPLDIERINSIVPGLITVSTAKEKDSIEADSLRDTAKTDAPMQPVPSKNKSEIEISTLNRMLDIIAEQQKTINDQQQLITTQQQEIAALTSRLLVQDRRRDYQVGSPCVAAEDIHKDEDD